MKRIIIATLLIITLICAGVLTFILTQNEPPAPDLAAIAKQKQKEVQALPPQKTAFKKGRRWIIHLHVPTHSSPAYAEYCNRLLSLILNRTVRDYGSYRVHLVDNASSVEIIQQDMTDDKIDITVQPCTTFTEKEMHAVRIPILRGIAAYHLLLIPEQQQAQFSATHKLHELKILQAGLLSNDPILHAMQAAGMSIQEFATQDTLRTQLATQQNDKNTTHIRYGIAPITDLFMEQPESGAHSQLPSGLRIEKQLCLVCPNPIYFYVGKQDALLHERLTAGFERSLFDGSFERLFNSCYTECIDSALLDGRRMLRIPNPALPAETPFQNSSWWYEPDGL